MILSEIEIRKFKEILLKMEANATAQLHLLNTKIKPGDRVQRDEAEDQDAVKAQMIRTETLLALAKAALRRIEVGTYGFCVQCEEAINPESLRKRPEASRCPECQGKILRRR